MRKSATSPWAILLGISLGGFFDGILLHQILQWHHLLSLVADQADIRLQVLWDGYFHALMYVIGGVGLAGLWRAQRHATGPGGRGLAGALLVGFGLWHVADAVLAHWLLGLHRVKLDSDTPLLWDLGWLVIFGVLPLAVGHRLVRGDRPSGPAARSRFLAVIAAAVVGAGAWSVQPPPGQPFTAVVFPANGDQAAAFAALAATGARLVWSDAGMGLIVVDVADGQRWQFYRHGALLVSGAGLPAGCFGWSSA